jgi:hypothetical protein
VARPDRSDRTRVADDEAAADGATSHLPSDFTVIAFHAKRYRGPLAAEPRQLGGVKSTAAHALEIVRNIGTVARINDGSGMGGGSARTLPALVIDRDDAHKRQRLHAKKEFTAKIGFR